MRASLIPLNIRAEDFSENLKNPGEVTCQICLGRYHTRPVRESLISCRGSLAQLVEQLAFNQLVAGSNPARPTNFPCFPIPFVLRGDTGSSLNFEYRGVLERISFKGTISDRRPSRRLLRRRIVRHKKDRFSGGLHPSHFLYLPIRECADDSSYLERSEIW